MKVRATKTGYFDGLRIPDTDTAEFEVPEGSSATWFEPVATVDSVLRSKLGQKMIDPSESSEEQV